MRFMMTSLLISTLMVLTSGAWAEETKVNLEFEAMVGDKPFACGQSYDAIGTTQSKITPSDFRFYVSEVALLDVQGKATPVTLEQDNVWQYKNLALLDFEDGTGACRNGNSGLHKAVVGAVPKGDYQGVRFTLGVPFALNHGDPTIAPSPLNFTALFWAWQSGYKFVKIDMASNGQPQATSEDAKADVSMQAKLALLEKVAAAKKSGKAPEKQATKAAGFSVHLGSTGCKSNTLTSPPSECTHPNRVSVTFDKFDVNKNVLVADLASLLKEANVDVNAPDSAPGCMSALNDADCPAVMTAFGLALGNNPASTQRFFSVK